MPVDANKELLRIAGLKVSFPVPRGNDLVAVNGVDLVINSEEIHGLIGESGSGKTVTALALIGLLGSEANVSGTVTFEGKSILGKSEAEWRTIRGHGIAMVFQDALGSLNPALKISAAFRAVLKLHRLLKGNEAMTEAQRLLEAVKLPDPDRVLNSYPHELSGGMAQRVTVALALACKPKLLVMDEPTSALDVDVAISLMKLLKELKTSEKISILIITHDLRLMKDVSDWITVIQKGKVIESQSTQSLLHNPLHSYTSGVIGATGSTPHRTYRIEGDGK